MKFKSIVFAVVTYLVVLTTMLAVDGRFNFFLDEGEPQTQVVEPPVDPPTEPQYASFDQALNSIVEDDQKEWLGYLASKTLDGRLPNTEGYKKAVKYIEDYCKEWGLKTERQDVPRRDQNLFAYIEGIDQELKDEIVVVGAHLDHLGRGRLGADDNGSGSVLVMSLAKAFSMMKPPSRTIVFQWYTAEESGLIGSRYYTSNPTFPKNNPDIDKHVAMINADMVGRFNGEITVTQQRYIKTPVPFDRFIAELEKRFPFASKITSNGISGSDHTSFLREGVPAVFLHTGLHRDYHRTSDTVDKINFEGLAEISKYAFSLAYKCTEADFADDESVSKTSSRKVYLPTRDHGGARFLN